MYKESENKDVSTENAVIQRAELIIDDHGILTVWVNLKYRNYNQHFGGYGLYLPKSFTHHSLESPAGHFIFRLLDVAGVRSFSELEGKAIRVTRTGSRITGIGHIVDDNWFFPDKDFEPLIKKNKEENADAD